MIDNPSMRPSTLGFLRPFRPIARCAALCALVASLMTVSATAQQPASSGPLATQFPAASIDSVPRADAALAATSSARSRVESEFKAAARACGSDFLVNACLDRARDVQRARLADIDAVELEANRYKRRERADRLDADRAKREAARTANEKADADLRARNRTTYDQKQVQAARENAKRAASDVRRTASPRVHKPAVTASAPASAETAARQRAKNAADYATKQGDAEVHQAEIKRRLAEKTAERKRRAEEKAAKDARSVAAQPAAKP